MSWGKYHQVTKYRQLMVLSWDEKYKIISLSMKGRIAKTQFLVLKMYNLKLMFQAIAMVYK